MNIVLSFLALLVSTTVCLAAVQGRRDMFEDAGVGDGLDNHLGIGENCVASNLDSLWEIFKTTYSKVYSTSTEPRRREIFENNVVKIVDHNLEHDLGMHTYRMGINEFADLTNDEFKRQMNGYRGVKVRNSTRTFSKIADINLPNNLDWRDIGIVTGVKNQQQCGSCWAFAAIASLESHQAQKTRQLGTLSEQNLVDCSGPEGNMGCDGGRTDLAFDYIIENGGIENDISYPYTGQDGTCYYREECSAATCEGFVDIPIGDEEALQQAVAEEGPVSVAIDASQEKFQFYKAGVFSETQCSSEELNHGVLVIGYGTEDGNDYWLGKNSWGVSWGEKGFMKMSRNQNNQCGIATEAIYPLV
ncbi:hypothetical protein JTE90_017458 [Oedothorax gibbosus]|uniref:Cathepsin L n=1 Tax=Oedothorax gibbosus TaxID=931172 RepID=A0AAV6U2Y8_9ARAC|nr:hypothetical protein JTE90_017458 [Oedothorax gibbosus]